MCRCSHRNRNRSRRMSMIRRCAYLCRGPRTYWRSRRPRLARRRGTSKERQSRDLHLRKRG